MSERENVRTQSCADGFGDEGKKIGGNSPQVTGTRNPSLPKSQETKETEPLREP